MSRIKIGLVALIALLVSACSDVAIYKNCRFAAGGDKPFDIRIGPNSVYLGRENNTFSALDGQVIDGDTVSVSTSDELWQRVVTIKTVASTNTTDFKSDVILLTVNNINKEFVMSLRGKDADGQYRQKDIYGKCGISS